MRIKFFAANPPIFSISSALASCFDFSLLAA